MSKIVTVIGARPQFIKAATVSRIFAQTPGMDEVLVHTGQHFDANMSDIFFDEMGIADPAHHLNISGGTHGAMTGRMLGAIEEVLLAEKPDMLMVYGDTNSTLAGALAAAKLHIPVAHVEAGLRSFNMAMPEEVNRRLTDHCATLLFTPTATADANLAHEGIEAARIIQVGDVMFDAALIFGAAARAQGRLLKDLGLTAGGFVLATVHRQENTDFPDRLRRILAGLQAIARDMPVVLPLHPRTRHCVAQNGFAELLKGLTVIDPQSYVGMVELEQGAAVIATDSGGVQKEAFFHGVPCVTLRDETEWVELIECGWNRLVPPGSADTDVAGAIRAAIGRRGRDVTPYGDGQAAGRIVAALEAHIAGKPAA